MVSLKREAVAKARHTGLKKIRYRQIEPGGGTKLKMRCRAIGNLGVKHQKSWWRYPKPEELSYKSPTIGWWLKKKSDGQRINSDDV